MKYTKTYYSISLHYRFSFAPEGWVIRIVNPSLSRVILGDVYINNCNCEVHLMDSDSLFMDDDGRIRKINRKREIKDFWKDTYRFGSKSSYKCLKRGWWNGGEVT